MPRVDNAVTARVAQPRATNVAGFLIIALILHPVTSFVLLSPPLNTPCGCERSSADAGIGRASPSGGMTSGSSFHNMDHSRAVLSSLLMLRPSKRHRDRVGTRTSRLYAAAQSKIARAADEADETLEAEAAASKLKNDQEWQFFDTARINVKAGDGGNGSVSIGSNKAVRRTFVVLSAMVD